MKLLLVALFVSVVGVFSYIYTTVGSDKESTQPQAQVVKTIVPVSNLTVQKLLEEVNAERAKVGVSPLIMDERLNQSAQQKADDMVKRDYYAHKDPDGLHGYTIAYKYAPELCAFSGENLSSGVGSNVSLNGTMESWIGSPAHYKAMVDPINIHTGFGISGNKVVEHFCHN